MCVCVCVCVCKLVEAVTCVAALRASQSAHQECTLDVRTPFIACVSIRIRRRRCWPPGLWPPCYPCTPRAQSTRKLPRRLAAVCRQKTLQPRIQCRASQIAGATRGKAADLFIGTNPDKPRNHKLDFTVLACVEMHIHEILTNL